MCSATPWRRNGSMRRSFVTDLRRERVLEPWAFVLVALSLGVALVLLFPRWGAIQQNGEGGVELIVDEGSLRYLQLLVAASPEDTARRLELTRALLEAGQLDEAAQSLEPLLDPPGDVPPKVRLLALEIDRKRLFAAAPESERRRRLARRVRRHLEGLPPAAVAPAKARDLALLARFVDAPRTGARMLERAAAAAGENAASTWQRIARLYHDVGDYEAAARAYERGALETTKPSARRAARALVDLWRRADRPARALAAAERMLRRFPGDPGLLARAQSLARANGAPGLALRYARARAALAEPEPGRTLLESVFEIELEVGAFTAAIETGRRLVTLGVDEPAFLGRYARLLEWRDRPHAALEHWLAVERAAPGLGREPDVVRLALATYAYDVAIDVLLARSRRRALTADELDWLVTASRNGGRAEPVAQRLEALVAARPGDRERWLAWLAVLGDLEHDQALARAYERFAARFPLTGAQRRDWARALAARGRAQAALDVLEPPRDDDAETAALRGRLAWQTESLDDLLAAYARLAALGVALDATQSRRRVRALLAKGQSEQAASVAVAAAERTGHPGLVELGLEAALQADALEVAERLVTLGGELELRTTRFWTFAAQFYQRRGESSRVERAYAQALTLAPGDDTIRAQYLWSLLALDAEERALHHAQRWGSGDPSPVLASALAAAFARAGEYDTAVRWYAQALPRHRDDWPWLLTYADALEGAGQGPAAYRLRRHVLHSLDTGTVAADAPAPRRARARASLALESAPNARARLAAGRRGAPGEAFWQEALIGWYLDQDRADVARHVLTQWQLERIRLPAWQRLSLALRAGDIEAVDRILASGVRLSPGDRSEALARAQRTHEAQRVALEALGSGVGDPDTARLRRLANTYENDHPHGAQAGVEARAIGDVDRTRAWVAGRRSYDAWSLGLAADRERLRGDAIVDRDRPINGAGLMLTGEQPDTGWSFELGYRDRDGGDLVPAAVHWRQRVSSRLQTRVGIAVEQLPEISGPMHLLGQRAQIGVSMAATLTKRTFWRGELRWRRYATRAEGARLGAGPGLTAEVGHRLGSGDPEWTVRAALDWQRYEREATLPASLADRLEPEIGIGSFLPQRSTTLSVGSSWRHGDPGSLTGRAPEPRYALDVVLGWREPEGEALAGVSGGFGWRVAGHDELALQLGASRDLEPGGGERARATLTYTYWFGR